MKKFLAIALLIVTITCCAFAFTACGNKVDLKGKKYYWVHSNPVGEGLIYEDKYIQFWTDGKTCQLRDERSGFESVKTGDYVQNGNTIKILWQGAIGVEEWKITTSGELVFNNVNYRIKSQQD